MCQLSCNLGASTSWNPQGVSMPVTGLLYLFCYLCASLCSVFVIDSTSILSRPYIVCLVLVWFSPNCRHYTDIVYCVFIEGLNDLYSSPNIVRVIKSRRMRWAGHVTRMCEERGCIGSWWGNRREGDQWGDLGVVGWTILRWISRRWNVGIWTGLGWPRIGTGGGRLWVR